MKEIHWGIIGCGEVTEVKSGPGFQRARHSKLHAVMRRTGRLAKDYADRHRVPKWYDKASALIDDPMVDAVYVATPPSSHKEYVLAAAAAGKPVYVEKPMALSWQECREMIAACERRNSPLFVAYYRRALPRFLKIKALIDNGTLGTVRAVNTVFVRPPTIRDVDAEKHWRVDPAIAGGGYFVDLGSHTIDILQFFLGDIVDAGGKVANQGGLYSAEDSISAQFIFESGIQATGLWNFNAHAKIDRTEIMGDKGSITFSTFGNAPMVLNTSRVKKIRKSNPIHIEQPLIQTIVDELLGHGKCPSTGSSAAKTNYVMDKILSGLP